MPLNTPPPGPDDAALDSLNGRKEAERRGIIEKYSQQLKGFRMDIVREKLTEMGDGHIRDLFVKDLKIDTGKGEMSGKFSFADNRRFEVGVMLAHAVPAEYNYVVVNKNNGEPPEEGRRMPDGSFYTESGEYIDVWEGSSFVAKKVAPPQSQAQVRTPTIAAPPGRPAGTVEKAGFSITDSIWVGDSLTKGVEITGAINGAQIVAESGKQTGWMRDRFRVFIKEVKEGKRPKPKVAVIRGFVNDIASGVDLDRVKRNLLEMFSLARENGIKVVTCTHHKWGTRAFLKMFKARWHRDHKYTVAELDGQTLEMNKWLLSQEGVTADKVVDIYSAVEDAARRGKNLLGRDELHLTGEGTRITAGLIKKAAGITA